MKESVGEDYDDIDEDDDPDKINLTTPEVIEDVNILTTNTSIRLTTEDKLPSIVMTKGSRSSRTS